MSESKLKTAILGLNREGQLLLEAASKIDCFQIEALADKDANLAEQLADQYKCMAFDDYRQLIIEMDSRLRGSDKRCLLVGADMYTCDEYVRMAMKKKFNVLKSAPAARTFEESAEFVRLADAQGTHFAVACPRRYAGSYLALRKFLEEGRLEQVFLIAAFCSFAGRPVPSWRTDPKLAGGGVLLHDSYEMIDQMMWNFPLPQQVYSLNTNQAADKQQRSYMTEDTAVLAMKFSDTLVGNLVASGRDTVWPRYEFIKVCGKDSMVVVNDTRMTVRDIEGKVIEEMDYDYEAVDCMAEALKSFAGSVLSPEEEELLCSGRENLKNMAVIESAYLSARTAMPEEPGRILQMGEGRI